MYDNVYVPVLTLQKTEPKNGGICKLRYCKHEDVQAWPTIDPLTGLCNSAIQLKPGGVMYLMSSVDKGKIFTEQLKTTSAGTYWDNNVDLTASGFNASNILSQDVMRYHKWVVLIDDREGDTRMLGNEDMGCSFIADYNSGDPANSRKGPMRFSWTHSGRASIYTAQAFNITVGGVTVTAGSLTLIMRFQVGKPGAPMISGDTILTNAGFANKNLLVLADGTGVSCDDGSGAINWAIPPASLTRHYQKTLASNTMTWVGAVNQDEIIEIYAFN